MALQLGELSAVISADDRPLEEGLDTARSKFARFGDKLQAGAALIGAAAGAALSAGIISTLEIDQANDKLAAQLGLSAEESQRMGKIAGDLYANAYGESLGEVNDALRDVTRNLGDLNDADLTSVTGSVLDLASAFEVDASEAARAVGKLLKTGLAKDATEALDLLTRGFQSGADEAGDLLDTVNEYSTQFREVGISGQKAFGLISQALAAGARDADTAADAIKEFAIRSKDGSAGSAAAFESIGLNAKKMTAIFAKGGPEADKAMKLVLDRLKAMKDPVEQDAAAVALFGGKSEDLGDALYALDPEHAVGVLGDVEGAAKKMGDTLADNANTKLEGFKRKVQQALVEKLAEAVPYIEKTFGWLEKHSDWVVPLATGLGIFAAAIYTITLAMKAWAAIQVVLNLALWTSPITWIVLAIIVLVAIIVIIATKTTWFQDVWGAAWGWIKKTAGDFWGWVTDTLWPGLKSFFSAIWDGIKAVGDAFSDAWGWIKKTGEKWWDWISAIPGKLKSVFVTIADFVSAPFKAGFNAVARFWNSTIGKLSWSVPGWVPFIGGNSISAPKLPQLAKGGWIPATPGGRLVNVGEGGQGEIVEPESKMAALLREAVAAGRDAAGTGHAEQTLTVNVLLDGELLDSQTLRVIRDHPEDVSLAVRAGDKSLTFAD